MKNIHYVLLLFTLVLLECAGGTMIFGIKPSWTAIFFHFIVFVIILGVMAHWFNNLGK